MGFKSLDAKASVGQFSPMPSPTHKSNKVRRRKLARNGKAQKVANRKRGTINYFNAFGAPASDDKRVSKA